MACLCVWSVARAQSIKPIDNVRPTIPQITQLPEPTPPAKSNGVGKEVRGNGTPIRASRTITEDALHRFLEQKGSPLADYSGDLLRSPFYSTIIAISNAEESFSINPYGSNNLFGLMSGGKLIRFDSFEQSLDAINHFLDKAENNDRRTVESFRAWYCYEATTADHICWNWESVVLKTKLEIESL